ncbi:MAG: N-acetylmuramoyl-L-alanine amidase [Oscillospiraceae bacterium]
MPLIFLSPSGKTYNSFLCVNADKATNEYAQMLRLALLIEKILQSYGVQTFVPPENTGMQARITQSNFLNADYYISLNCTFNGFTEVFYDGKCKASQRCARLIFRELEKILPYKIRDAKNGQDAFAGLGFAELRLTVATAILVKISACNAICTSYICENLEKPANAIAIGILKAIEIIA